MKLEPNKVGLINYSLTDSDGNLIDSSNGQALAYLHGHSNLIPGLEKQLEGKATGDKFTADIPAAEGYGEIEPHLIQEDVPKSMFQGVDNLEVGMRFEAQTEQGVHSVEITDVQDETVTVDGNHPLAGKDLSFDIEVMGVRDATEEELAHGHAHGEGGHQH
ncbi:MAG: FKBP-type peptidyl-prolyl cis-trans isomerase [Hydrogenovibrio sp.]